jgi:hypothetical protein
MALVPLAFPKRSPVTVAVSNQAPGQVAHEDQREGSEQADEA